MFTGLVEEVGRVQAIVRGARSCELRIQAKTVLEDVSLGDSIATNGVCLTVTRCTAQSFSADVMHETLNRSSLGSLSVGSPVNLERALPANGRFGGHIVSGHIDGTGTIAGIEEDGNAVWYRIAAPPDISRLVVEKGSIAIDGISLTVARVGSSDFSVSVIPHTRANTALVGKRVGDVVNLETDVIGKYVERLMTFGRVPGASASAAAAIDSCDGGGASRPAGTGGGRVSGGGRSSGGVDLAFLRSCGF